MNCSCKYLPMQLLPNFPKNLPPAVKNDPHDSQIDPRSSFLYEYNSV